MSLFAGNAGIGVQVRTVLPALQTGDVGNKLNVVESINSASVAVGSIASLNVKVTGAAGATPVAKFVGTVETMVGSVWADAEFSNRRMRTQSAAKNPRGVQHRKLFIYNGSFKGN
jgi:hypothetical protein